jgi:hypothetical protein
MLQGGTHRKDLGRTHLLQIDASILLPPVALVSVRRSQPLADVVHVGDRRRQSAETNVWVDGLHPGDDDFENGTPLLSEEVDLVNEEEGLSRNFVQVSNNFKD